MSEKDTPNPFDEMAGEAAAVSFAESLMPPSSGYQEPPRPVDNPSSSGYHEPTRTVGNPSPKADAADVLSAGAATFRGRNAVYGDNFRNVAPVMAALFPGGVPPELVLLPHWHLFELLVVKLTRFANSDLAHQDSIHDAMVYAAMVEAFLLERNDG